MVLGRGVPPSWAAFAEVKGEGDMVTPLEAAVPSAKAEPYHHITRADRRRDCGQVHPCWSMRRTSPAHAPVVTLSAR